LEGRTALFYLNGAYDISNPEEDRLSPGINLLIRNGVYIDDRDNAGRTPLMFSIANGENIKVKRLIEMGANKTLKDKQGKSIFDIAEEMQDSVYKDEMLRILRDTSRKYYGTRKITGRREYGLALTE
jgi:ankyrin repeat protein